MTKIYLIFTLAILSGTAISAQQSFTTGNLVVYKVNTNPEDTLSSAGFPVSIDEYTTTGTFVKSHLMPVTVNGSNRRIIASGSATSEGQLTRSVDKKFLLIPGYDTFPDPNRSSISGSPSLIINRVVGIMGADGVLDATTALTNTYSGNSFRGIASTNGIDMWLSGTGSGSSNGIRYTKKGMDTSMRLSTTVTNTRVVNIFNGQLYCTTGSGSFKAVASVGSGLPVDSQQVITVLPGMDTTSSVADPYAFSIKPGTGDVIYVADSRTKKLDGTGGGVQKWIKDAGTNKWSLQYTIDSLGGGLAGGLNSISVDWTNVNPIIYGITDDGTKKDSTGNKIISVTDTGAGSVFIVLGVADVNSTFRGIAFAPEPAASLITFTFIGNGNWTDAANWTNNVKPPSTLLAGSEIIINHTANGSCILDTAQTILAGAKLTINPGKNVTVPGLLEIK